MPVQALKTGADILYGTPSAITGLSSPLSVSCWLNWSTYAAFEGGSATPSIVDVTVHPFSAGHGFTFMFDPTTGGHLQFIVWGNTQIGNWETAAITAPAAWKHIAATWDGGTGAANTKIWFDGVSQSVSLLQTLSGTWSMAGASVRLLQFSDSLNQTLQGNLQDVRVYNKVLTAGDIAGLKAMNKSTLQSLDTNLVWCDELLYSVGHGTTLPFTGVVAGTDRFYDRINGDIGTPTGSSTVGAVADGVFGTGF